LAAVRAAPPDVVAHSASGVSSCNQDWHSQADSLGDSGGGKPGLRAFCRRAHHFAGVTWRTIWTVAAPGDALASPATPLSRVINALTFIYSSLHGTHRHQALPNHLSTVTRTRVNTGGAWAGSIPDHPTGDIRPAYAG